MIVRRLFGISLLAALVAAVVAVRCLVPVVAPDPPAATPVPPVVVVTVPAATATGTFRPLEVQTPTTREPLSTPLSTATATSTPSPTVTETPRPATPTARVERG